MEFLNRDWAFNFIFFFVNSSSSKKVLIVSDFKERTNLNFELFGREITFLMPEMSTEDIAQKMPQAKDIRIYGKSDFPENEKFDVLVIDKRKPLSNTAFNRLTDLVKENGDVVIFNWRKKKRDTVKKLLWNFGLIQNSKTINDDSYFRYLKNRLNINWFFFVDPGLHKPRRLVRRGFKTQLPWDDANGIKRVIKKAGYFYLIPQQSIIFAKKNPEKTNTSIGIIQEIIKNTWHDDPAAVDYNRAIRQFFISGTNILLLELVTKSKQCIIRLPLTPTALSRLNKQYDLLKEINKSGVRNVPQPVSINTQSGLPYFIENRIKGHHNQRQLFIKPGKKIIKLHDQALNALLKLNENCARQISIDESTFDKYLAGKIKIIQRKSGCEKSIQNSFELLSEKLRATLLGKTAMAGICHGDFKIENCIFEKNGELKGVIDWDMGEFDELNLFDLSCLFMDSIRHNYLTKYRLAPFVLNLQHFPSEFLPSFNLYFKKTATTPIDPEMLVAIYWLDRIYKLMTYRDYNDKVWIDKNVITVINHFHKKFTSN